jgi:hypothetical protein
MDDGSGREPFCESVTCARPVTTDMDAAAATSTREPFAASLSTDTFGASLSKRSKLPVPPPHDPMPEDIANTRIPLSTVEEAMKDAVRDGTLISELLVFVPFMAIFLIVTLSQIDIEPTHYAIVAAKHLTRDQFFASWNVQNRSLWEQLSGSDTPLTMENDGVYSDVAGTDRWAQWLSSSVRRLFLCEDTELPFRSADEAKVEGWTGMTAPLTSPSACDLLNSTSNGTNATFSGLAINSTRNSSNCSYGNNSTSSNGTTTTSAPTTDPAPSQQARFGDYSTLEGRGWLPRSPIGQLTPVGALRLRVQMVKENSCGVPKHRQETSRYPADVNLSVASVIGSEDCFANDLNSNTEAKHPLRCNLTDPLNPSSGAPLMYQYQACNSIAVGAYTTTELGRYHCGGYVVDIPFNLTCVDARRVLYQLTASSCPLIDASGAQTRFFALEYFAYVVSLDAYVSVKHIVEITAGGAWIPTDQFRGVSLFGSGRYPALLITLDFVFLIFVLYYVVVFFYDWRAAYRVDGRVMQHLCQFWVLLDAVNVGTYVSVFIIRWMWWGYSATITRELPYASEYPLELETVLSIFSSMRYATTFNLLLTFIKLLKFVRISDRLAIITLAFEKAQMDMLSLVAIFVVVVLGYAVAGTALFGTQLADFASLDRSFSTLMFMLLGELDYPAMRLVQPTLAGFYFWTFLILGLFLLLNCMVVVIGDSFEAAGEEQFVAPLAESALATIDEVVWSLRPSTWKARYLLWKDGKTPQMLDKLMLAYVIQEHYNQRQRSEFSKPASPEQLFRLLPPSLRERAHPFFVHQWRTMLRWQRMQEATVEAQTDVERRRSVLNGVRMGIPGGADRSRVLAKTVTAQLDSLRDRLQILDFANLAISVSPRVSDILRTRAAQRSAPGVGGSESLAADPTLPHTTAEGHEQQAPAIGGGGDWVRDSETRLLWSDSVGMYYSEELAWFYDPESRLWYDPTDETWFEYDSGGAPVDGGDDWARDSETGLLWSDSVGMYYSEELTWFYDPKSRLWYDPKDETWFEYDYDGGVPPDGAAPPSRDLLAIARAESSRGLGNGRPPTAAGDDAADNKNVLR